MAVLLSLIFLDFLKTHSSSRRKKKDSYTDLSQVVYLHLTSMFFRTSNTVRGDGCCMYTPSQFLPVWIYADTHMCTHVYCIDIAIDLYEKAFSKDPSKLSSSFADERRGCWLFSWVSNHEGLVIEWLVGRETREEDRQGESLVSSNSHGVYVGVRTLLVDCGDLPPWQAS